MKYRIKLLKKPLISFLEKRLCWGFCCFGWLVLFVSLLFLFWVLCGLVFLFLKYDARDLIFMFLIRCFMEKHLVKVNKRKLSMTLLIREGTNFKSNVNRQG